jgi:methylmalonyl-CoA mutase
VTDPASGAGAFEALTEALAERAWALFQEIEREGGIVESLRGSLLQERIAGVHAERERNVSRRADPITGTSEFPNLQEEMVAVLIPLALPEADEVNGPSPGDGGTADVEAGQEEGTQRAAPSFASLLSAAASGASLLDRRTVAPGPGETVATSLPSRRDAEGFEKLRDLSDTHLARTGARPQVFLANLGPVAAFTSRATFAKAFFEAGGIEAPASDGFAALDALAAAFRASGARIACLCSSDEVYATDAAALAAEALAAAGAVRIYLAGRPTSGQEHLGGIHVTFINTDCNALDLLAAAQRAAAGQNPPGNES